MKNSYQKESTVWIKLFCNWWHWCLCRYGSNLITRYSPQLWAALTWNLQLEPGSPGTMKEVSSDVTSLHKPGIWSAGTTSGSDHSPAAVWVRFTLHQNHWQLYKKVPTTTNTSKQRTVSFVNRPNVNIYYKTLFLFMFTKWTILKNSNSFVCYDDWLPDYVMDLEIMSICLKFQKVLLD